LFRFKLNLFGCLLFISLLAVGCSRGLSINQDAVITLATPIAQSPAAGICADFAEEVVTVTIHPDITDPRCSFIHPDQILEVINNRDETITIVIGHLEASLAPGESHLFDLPFGEYLAPGVHRIDVQPCCGAELVLGEIGLEP
jgi:hypothetical protein